MTACGNEPSASFAFDGNVFRLSAIKKAAYRFGDRFFVEIETSADNRIHISLRSKQGIPIPQAVEGEFRNEVLDQDLREHVLEETEGVRNLLLAQAFSKTSLIASESETARYEGDPLRIRQSETK